MRRPWWPVVAAALVAAFCIVRATETFGLHGDSSWIAFSVLAFLAMLSVAFLSYWNGFGNPASDRYPYRMRRGEPYRLISWTELKHVPGFLVLVEDKSGALTCYFLRSLPPREFIPDDQDGVRIYKHRDPSARRRY